MTSLVRHEAEFADRPYWFEVDADRRYTARALELVEAVQRARAIGVGHTQAMIDALAYFIVNWSLTAADGAPLPVTVDALKTVPLPQCTQMGNALVSTKGSTKLGKFRDRRLPKRKGRGHRDTA
jgi:hypothetical protein